MNEVLRIILRTLDMYRIIILVSIVLSWLDRYGQWGITKIVKQLTDPFLNKLKVIVPIGGIYLDLSPIIGLFLISLIKNILIMLFSF